MVSAGAVEIAATRRLAIAQAGRVVGRTAATVALAAVLGAAANGFGRRAHVVITGVFDHASPCDAGFDLLVGRQAARCPRDLQGVCTAARGALIAGARIAVIARNQGPRRTYGAYAGIGGCARIAVGARQCSGQMHTTALGCVTTVGRADVAIVTIGAAALAKAGAANARGAGVLGASACVVGRILAARVFDAGVIGARILVVTGVRLARQAAAG